MQTDTLSRLVDHLKKQTPDFTTITGDLVNLSTKKEFEQAGSWLKDMGSPKNICVIPGNHDVYIGGSLKKFRAACGQYITGEMIEKAPFPFLRSAGNVAIIACSSAIPTPPFMAYGAFDKQQAKRLATCLEVTKKAGYFRIVLIHHPPYEAEASRYRKGLHGADIFRDVIEQHGAELILHGHTHRSTINAIKGSPIAGGAEVPVIGVAAASADASSGADPARYNLFEIEKVGTKWSCTMREFGYQRIGDDITMRLKMRIY